MIDFGEIPVPFWNFATGNWDWLSGKIDTDEKAVKYIPQGDAAQGLFRVYRLQGHSINYAMINVLRLSAGMPVDENIT